LVSANPYYFKVDTAGNQLPYINEQNEVFISDLQLINLKITAGEVDLKSNALSLTDYSLFKENETNGNYRVELPPAGLAGGMGYTFNLTTKDPVLREIFSDVRFKQAMSLAIDREEINQTVFLGLAKPQQFTAADPLFVKFVTPEQSGYMAEFDGAKANTLLDDMGLKKGTDGFRVRSDGKPLIINMEYTVLGGPALTHQLVKQYWEAVGVQVNLKEVSTEAFRTRNLSNDQDIFVWRTDGTAAPSLIANSLNAFVPFQASGLQVKAGIPWGKYWASDGAEGEKPAEWAEQLRNDAIAIGALAPYSDEWNALGTKLVQQWNDQLITIGTVGNVPVPLVVSNRMGNTPPAFTSQIWDFYCLFPFRVDQEFIKE
jgi:peptide/nickel transport system substrate-binding protein